jgi:hypothetical protein
MNDLIQRLVNAIFRQEGMPADNTNPGNLRACPWLSIEQRNKERFEGGFWRPDCRSKGVAGAAWIVALHVGRGASLTELIYSWAPPCENNSSAYVRNVRDWAQIPDEHLPLWDYIA